MSILSIPAIVETPTATTQTPVLRVDGLRKRFPVRRGWREMARRPFQKEWAPALKGVAFEVGTGEFFGLLGPNGAGKTTLFKILATLVLPDGGTAHVAGYDVVRQADRVRRVLTPVIADERSLFWRLSARENLRLFAALHGIPRRAGEQRIEELLEVVGLEDAAEKMVGAFSSGMKQRLLIARSLLARPKVLLLDEPTRSLDPLSARSFRRFLREEVVGRQGCTVLLATHSADEALGLCDRLAVLHHGELLAQGTATELAKQFGEERYRLWVKGDGRWRPALLQAETGIRVVHPGTTGDDGWVRIEFETRGGWDRTAAVISGLNAAGVAVGGLERVGVGLADLLDRIVHSPEGGSDA